MANAVGIGVLRDCISVALSACLVLGSVVPLEGQSFRVGDPLWQHARIRQILGSGNAHSYGWRSFVERPGGSDQDADSWSNRAAFDPSPTRPLGLMLIDPRVRIFLNSRFPTGRNDGAIWQGRGVTGAFDSGARAHWGPLEVTVHPMLIVTQNSSFDLAPVTDSTQSRYAYPWRRIDLPQRFGPRASWSLDPGQSEARVRLGRLLFGVSTANLWWGPSIRNAIVMSNNGPGFPHAFIGTDGVGDSRIGTFEALWIWGRLTQSDWFEGADNDRRFVTGAVAVYSPAFLEGLSLGITRVFYMLVPGSGLSLGDYLSVLQPVRKEQLVTPDNLTGDDERDQLFSLFGRWVFPRDGFEIYGEWARNDHSWKASDFFLEPEHSQAYTLGLQKAIRLRSGDVIALGSEVTHLERSATLQVRDSPTYYTHRFVTQGYTHKGQVIGAGIGPGGNSQYVGGDWYTTWGSVGAYLERQVHDNDAYYAWASENDVTYCCHDVSVNVGTRAVLFMGRFDLGAEMTVTREYNRYFFGLDLWNANLSLSATWRREVRSIP